VPERRAFDAVIEAADGGGEFVRLPADAASVFGTRARFPVRVTFNGIPYTGSTMPMGDGTFGVGILKSIRTQAGLDIGDTVAVVLERDTTERVVDVPAELAGALAASPAAAARFEALSFTHRREHPRYVAEANAAETRRQRAARTVERLLSD
jgi:Domain of unknown function (DUF1905)/Bacteriocin-protection, YdeI or OmpD-Associated